MAQAKSRGGLGLVSVQDGLERLRIASQTIRLRKALHPGDEKRLGKDVSLYKNGILEEEKVGVERRKKYLNFLHELRAPPSIRVLCMVGLGLSVIAVTRDKILVALLDILKERSHTLDNSVLRQIAVNHFHSELIPQNSNSATCITANLEAQRTTQQEQRTTEGEPDPVRRVTRIGFDILLALRGDVYELSLEDLKQIIESGHISGSIILTDTYGVNTTSFITIKITNELTDKLITNRPRVAWINPHS
ncbi:hypothetical protein BDV41DRAFT_543143 [Aspergillus transmontanensis]|uniref:Uncharacterized protein n=1 Tax=Aspergillus transmontanensis TaxID=1034304 RepID=A0A5N6VV76_9EURO|nr:hypothetical protein BDV41DRAFT_543143 [Aspergillus transmontanensis]